ncbi:hypothetical protein [Nocardia sp. CC227C]|uniref:hypothetical protein n=1 Tax=Nocardia sp. CC227C TaxID=3044562 RepID=UPI00278C2A04|nr:hypothetical protein [Nocardia sp. CC227C]
MGDKEIEATETGPEPAAAPPAEPVVTVEKASGERSAEPDPGERTARSFTVALPSFGRWGPMALRVAAVVALIALAVSTIVLFRDNRHNENLLAAHADARAAACAYAPVLVTYDAEDLDSYFTAVLDGAAGEWRDQFDSTSKELREVLTQGEVVAESKDVQCAIRTGDEDSAEAIVVIGQTITSLGTQGQPAPGQLSMVMWLERSGDRWLVNKLQSPLAQLPQS